MALTPYNPSHELRASVMPDEGRISFTVPEELAGMQAGTFLKRCGVSAKTMRTAKRVPEGITQNGSHIRTVDPVAAGAVVSVSVGGEERGYLRAQGIDIPVLYEDDHLIAFDKPAGLNTHPSNRDARDSLLNYAHQHFENRVFRPLTRLDKQTSGVLLTAKTAFAATAVKSLPQKFYLALAQGEITGPGTIDLPIARSQEHIKRRVVAPEGARSVTHYRPLAVGGGHTLLLIRLETGRTHQIRVHLGAAGHLLAGDSLYGGKTGIIARQALHCALLRFEHPFSGESVRIEAPPPPDFKAACENVFGSIPNMTIWSIDGRFCCNI